MLENILCTKNYGGNNIKMFELKKNSESHVRNMLYSKKYVRKIFYLKKIFSKNLCLLNKNKKEIMFEKRFSSKNYGLKIITFEKY